MTNFENRELEETTERAASPYVRLMTGGTDSVPRPVGWTEAKFRGLQLACGHRDCWRKPNGS